MTKSREGICEFDEYVKGKRYRAIICTHSLAMGPALGGIRMKKYADMAEARIDVKRLAETMTMKNAHYQTFGGGKMVVIGDPRIDKTRELLHWIGQKIESFGGLYIGAEDMGMAPEDMLIIAEKTSNVRGLPIEHGGSGNPAPFTAEGVVHAIRACRKHRFQNDTLSGLKVVVQGVGSVGAGIIDILKKHGLKRITIADTSSRNCIDILKKHTSLHWIPPDNVYDEVCDVFIPCAVGGILNAKTIPRLRCSIVAGSANSQLATVADAWRLMQRGIVHAPDPVASAGGIINIGAEFEPGGYNPDVARKKVEGIYYRILAVLAKAKHLGMPPSVIADKIAEKELAHARELKGVS